MHLCKIYSDVSRNFCRKFFLVHVPSIPNTNWNNFSVAHHDNMLQVWVSKFLVGPFMVLFTSLFLCFRVSCSLHRYLYGSTCVLNLKVFEINTNLENAKNLKRHLIYQLKYM